MGLSPKVLDDAVAAEAVVDATGAANGAEHSSKKAAEMQLDLPLLHYLVAGPSMHLGAAPPHQSRLHPRHLRPRPLHQLPTLAHLPAAGLPFEATIGRVEPRCWRE